MSVSPDSKRPNIDFRVASRLDGAVGVLTFKRAPHNYVSVEMLREIDRHVKAFEQNAACRCVVLHSNGKVFCGGADFNNASTGERIDSAAVYSLAVSLYGAKKPLIAAIQGPAIGAGLGLALVADFRVGCPESRFSANFNRIGIHPGFGLSFTLPDLIGRNRAASMFYTGRRVKGQEAFDLGLVDWMSSTDELVDFACARAREIAESSPVAVQSTRSTLREEGLQRIQLAVQRELRIQILQFASNDFLEGVAAMQERRIPNFIIGS